MKNLTTFIKESLEPELKKLLRRLNLNAKEANEIGLDDDAIMDLSDEGYGLVSAEAIELLSGNDIEILKKGKNWVIVSMDDVDEDTQGELEENDWLADCY